MTDEGRKAKNQYQREWHKAHPEKRREYQANYWERKGKILEQDVKLKTKRDPQRVRYIKYALAEDDFMGALVLNQELFNELPKVEPYEFITDSNREIYKVLYSRLCEGKSIDLINLGEFLTDEQMAHLSIIISKRSRVNSDIKMAEQIIKIIQSAPQELKQKLQKINCAKEVEHAYTEQYRRNNPEKVKKWRQNAIVNAYAKLIAEHPEMALKENK